MSSLQQMADDVVGLATQVQSDVTKQIATGNKAAGRRARQATIKIRNLCKEIRRTSLDV